MTAPPEVPPEIAPEIAARRPPGRGQGLGGPACGERARLDQGVGRRPPGQAICVRCGRVTARRDADDMPWCGGDFPEPPGSSVQEPEPPSVEDQPTPARPEPTSPGSAPAKRPVRYNPKLKRHSWNKPQEHHRRCGFCGIHVVNEHSDDRRTWWQTWTLPNGQAGTNKGDPRGRVPQCPGPGDGGGGG